MKITRREFIKRTGQVSAAALLGGVVENEEASGCLGNDEKDTANPHPNILLLMVDQQQMPPPGYARGEGLVQGLKEILGFEELSPNNPYTRFFPGYMRLRQNGVVLRTHYTASSACVPSRACIMTGSYTTGVTQTDGLFKTADDVPWLDPDGTPTIGDWFQAVGYSAHYFGKWHVSDPPSPGSLEPWGFLDWEKSYPEPHGGGPGNLGVYRDVGFTENVVEFLKEQASDSSGKPWFAVGSVVNPHDVSSWPVNWQLPSVPANPDQHGVVPWEDYPPPPGIPVKGEQSLEGTLPDGDTLVVPLNPDGLPQDVCSLPRTFRETLKDKPRCQYDYSLKYGLIMKSLQEYNFQQQGSDITSAAPFQLQGEWAKAWSLAYYQQYVYCHYLADLHLNQMLQALDRYNLTDKTIVVFLSDHGEMAGAHGGMIQKWHNAYEEAIRVPMVVSSPLVNRNKHKMREIHQPTSSIDVAPTLLALAGYDPKKVRAKMESIHGKSAAGGFVGANLAPHIKGRKLGFIHWPDGRPRTGVFYTTDDTISEPGATLWEDQDRINQFTAFLDNVRKVKEDGYPLALGTVRQPNHVRALCTGDWKIVHYVDPKGGKPDEWELYYLRWDPIERINLVDFRTGDVRRDITVPGFPPFLLRLKNKLLKMELARLEGTLGVGNRLN